MSAAPKSGKSGKTGGMRGMPGISGQGYNIHLKKQLFR